MPKPERLPRSRKELEAKMQEVQESEFARGVYEGKRQSDDKPSTPSRQLTAVEQLAQSLALKQEARDLLVQRQLALSNELAQVTSDLNQNNYDRLQLLRDFDRFAK